MSRHSRSPAFGIDGENGDQAVTSCAIITTPANELVEALHDRMPAMLPSEAYDAWLDPRTDSAALSKMLVPFPASKMKSHPVSRTVMIMIMAVAIDNACVDAEVGNYSNSVLRDGNGYGREESMTCLRNGRPLFLGRAP